MNDKNRRNAANERRRALHSANNEYKTSELGSNCSKIARNPPRSAMFDHGNIKHVLQTPKEILDLQCTLKGVLDWQQDVKNSTLDRNYCWAFHDLLLDMRQCIIVSDSNPSMCGKVTPHLRKTSAKLQSRIAKCTPLEVLASVDLLSCFAFNRNSSPLYYESSRFLINAAVEAFPDSHPTLLLLRLLLDACNLTPPQLVMTYKVGSNVLEQFYGAATAFQFRIGMHMAAAWIGLGATIRSYADTICAAAHNVTNSEGLFAIGRMYETMGEYEKSADALRRCLAQIENEGNGGSWASVVALKFLAFLQSKINDFVGEEIILRKVLKTTLARDRRKLHTSQLSIDALDAISDLETFYALHGLDEERYALHMEFPSAFEL
jgi:tetratricopeptide (TPR) repeat protein